jgi:hypothetical protein
VIGCKPTLETRLTGEWDDTGYKPPSYIITFTYTVGGKTFRDKFKLGSPRENGHTFEIQYDPRHPEKNTGSEVPLEPWARLVVWSVFIPLTLLAIWFFDHWGK